MANYMMSITPMPPDVVLQRELPDWLRLAIADAVVVFGRMEQEAIEIVWLLRDATLAEKLKAARDPATDTLTTIVEIIERTQSDLDFSAIKSKIVDLAQERNMIVHGSWCLANDKPYVVWHKFLVDDEHIIGEYFEKLRFDNFMNLANHLLSTLFDIHAQLEILTDPSK